MKKFLMGAAAFCCMLTSVALTSCGKDKDEPQVDEDVNVVSYKETVMVVDFNESSEILEICDATVSVNGGAAETITSPDWSKTVKTDKLPATFSVEVKMNKKEGKEWDSEKSYKVYLDPVSVTIYHVFSNGTKSTILDPINFNTSGGFTSIAALDLVLKKISSYSYDFVIDKDGKLTMNKK